MSYIGDFAEDYATLNTKFATVKSTGAPTVLSGNPVIKVYKGSATDTESTAGITLSVDFDSVVGLNNVLIDLSSDAFYAVGEDYHVIITTGTVDSVSVVGYVVAEFSIENRVADMVKISGDSTAADNLELQYDTTGLTGGKFPSNQDQVGAIGTSGGAALNFGAADDNVDGALNGVTFVGVQTTNTFTATEAEDGTNHVIDDTTNNIDIVYQFNIGGGRTGTEVIWKGFLAPNGSSMNIQVYDFIGTDWETQGTITGKNQSVNETIDFPILSKHTGTGANIGIVYVRLIIASGTNQTLNTDQLIVEAVSIGQSVGYALGAVWIDTVNGTAGTENHVNGTASNPTKSIADANTIASSLNLNRFSIAPNSSITLGASQENEEFLGRNWTLDLSGESVSNSHFSGADVSGIGTSSTEAHYDHCEMGDSTLGICHIDDSDLEGDLTMASAGTYFILGCYHTAAVAPIIDFGTASSVNTTIHIHDYHGAITVKNMGQSGTDVLHFSSPDGKLTLDSSNVGGTVNLNGVFDFVNSGSSQTINDDGHTQPKVIARLVNPQVNTALSDITFEMYDAAAHTPATGLTVTGERSLDGGAYAAVTGTIAEISDGTYQIDASAADMNGALVVMKFVATGADTTYVHIKTAA